MRTGRLVVLLSLLATVAGSDGFAAQLVPRRMFLVKKPEFGARRVIWKVREPSSVLGVPAPATLVSVFSIAPTFDPTVDAAGDLPGPGMLALPGILETYPFSSPCP
jgi:hypothetical protein